MKLKDKIIKLLKSIKLKELPALIAFLGSYAGSHGTSLLWRRAGIASVVTLTAYISGAMNPAVGWVISLWYITCMSLWGSYSLGYGIPDDAYPSYPPTADSGSDIGRFWTMLFRKYTTFAKAHRLADYFTRGTVALAKVTATLSIPIIKGNWISFIAGALLIILSNVLISWRGWGNFKQKMFGKEIEFLWSDITNYSLEGVGYSLMIFGNV